MCLSIWNLTHQCYEKLYVANVLNLRYQMINDAFMASLYLLDKIILMYGSLKGTPRPKCKKCKWAFVVLIYHRVTHDSLCRSVYKINSHLRWETLRDFKTHVDSEQGPLSVSLHSKSNIVFVEVYHMKIHLCISCIMYNRWPRNYKALSRA